MLSCFVARSGSACLAIALGWPAASADAATRIRDGALEIKMAFRPEATVILFSRTRGARESVTLPTTIGEISPAEAELRLSALRGAPRIHQTLVQLVRVQSALTAYAIANNHYPDVPGFDDLLRSDGLFVELVADGWLSRIDGFGRVFRYSASQFLETAEVDAKGHHVHRPFAFDVVSAGGDGRFETADDLRLPATFAQPER